MWWALRSLTWVPDATSCAVACETSEADHLYVAYAPWQPRRHPIYRTFRGRTHLCGYQWVWDTPIIAEQVAPGDTLLHIIHLTPLLPETTYWAYVFAPDGPYGREIQGPLFSFTTEAAPPGPQPTPDPIYWEVHQRVIRCGNHYSWWANDTWYAFIPTAFFLTVWKLVEGAMVRQDQPNEPTPPLGYITDGDSRMQPDTETLHMGYFCRVPMPGNNLIRYATFDLTSDTWAIDEQACTAVRGAGAASDLSLSLDAADIPHLVYTETFAGLPYLAYRNRIGGVWSARETALWRNLRYLDKPSAAHDPDTNHFHVTCTSTISWNYVNRRSPAGVWDGINWLPVQGVNLPHHTINAPVDTPHFGQISTGWRVNHHEGTFPYVSQLALTAPTSQMANVITTLGPNPGHSIFFRDAANHLAYVYRPPAAPWDAEVQLAPGGLAILTATYAHPDVISCLWAGGGAVATFLYALAAPW